MTVRIPAPLLLDVYKNSHRRQYSPHTEVVYSTWTPRKSRIDGVDKVVTFGIQAFVLDYLVHNFNETFFNRPKEEVISEIKSVMENYCIDSDTAHWEALHDLGYLPLEIRALPEGTLCPIRCPMLTIENTKPEFYWLTNFVETIFSTEVWKPMTSATIALEYRKILDSYAEKTCDNNAHVDYQGHDFSFRGMAGVDGGLSSGAGHLTSFIGSDTLPAVLWIEKYYQTKNINGSVATSIPATEHSVAETNIIEIQEILEKNKVYYWKDTKTGKSREFELDENTDPRMIAEAIYFQRLLSVYPKGFFSYVSDTYNLWDVCTQILPMFRDQILNRDGRVVVRPDSGDPCDILCGYNTKTFFDDYRGVFKPVRLRDEKDTPYYNEINKGVIELLWDTFGGTINSKGYKVLDPHIGCIYGDAITIERAQEICERLEKKGFASSNVVLGIGSYTYNMNTRDTFGFALKTTYGVVNGKELLLYKDPITDDGTKKSQRGRVIVTRNENGDLTYVDNLYKEEWEELVKEGKDELRTIFKDGNVFNLQNFHEIRSILKQETSNEKQLITV